MVQNTVGIKGLEEKVLRSLMEKDKKLSVWKLAKKVYQRSSAILSQIQDCLCLFKEYSGKLFKNTVFLFSPEARLKTQPCPWILKMSFSILFVYFLWPCTLLVRVSRSSIMGWGRVISNYRGVIGVSLRRNFGHLCWIGEALQYIFKGLMERYRIFKG